jgi:hypothetical protein
MQAVEKALLSFFERVARRDEGALQGLRSEPRFRVDERGWRFTLPDLYGFLQAHDEAFGRVTYGKFCRSIFTCPLNRALKRLGAEIVIADNQARVDESRYALV